MVHTRDAQDETIDLIREYGSTQVAGVLHCFTESWEMAEKAIDLGYYISMSGIVSFRKRRTCMRSADESLRTVC